MSANGTDPAAAAPPPWASKLCHRNFGWAVVPVSAVQLPAGLVGTGQQAIEMRAQRLVAPCTGPTCALFVQTEGGGVCGDLLAVVASHDRTQLIREDIEAEDEDLDDEDEDDVEVPPREPAAKS